MFSWLRGNKTEEPTIQTSGIFGGKKVKPSKWWSRKYKLSINCKRPRGFSQRQYCKYGMLKTRKNTNATPRIYVKLK